jgi:hypothetical protein
VANRTAGRGGVGLGLGGGLHGPTLQLLGLALHLHFQVAEVLIAGSDELSDSRFQVDGQFRRHYRQRSRTMRTTTRTYGSRQAGCIHAVVLAPTPTFVRSKTEMRRAPGVQKKSVDTLSCLAKMPAEFRRAFGFDGLDDENKNRCSGRSNSHVIFCPIYLLAIFPDRYLWHPNCPGAQSGTTAGQRLGTPGT